MAKKVKTTAARIHAFADRLAALPPKEKTEYTGRELVSMIEATLRVMLARGHTFADIAKWIEKEFGIRLRPETVARYLRDAQVTAEPQPQLAAGEGTGLTPPLGKSKRAKDTKTPATSAVLKPDSEATITAIAGTEVVSPSTEVVSKNSDMEDYSRTTPASGEPSLLDRIFGQSTKKDRVQSNGRRSTWDTELA